MSSFPSSTSASSHPPPESAERSPTCRTAQLAGRRRSGRSLSSVQHVLWIGGAPGSGKTTIARRLARRHGLRLYSADTQTWVHRDRALRAGVAAAERWETLVPSQRWEQSSGELLELSLHAERGSMVLDDLECLPRSPLIVAEGSTLPAWAISSGRVKPSNAVWLLPTAEFQTAQFVARQTAAGPQRLYRLLAEMAQWDAQDHGIPALTIDGSASVSETVASVEHLFGGVLTTAPKAVTPDERQQLLREMNQAVVDQVRGYYGRPWAEGDAEVVVRLFACECAGPECEVDLALTVGLASIGPVLAAGHS